jgi:hypothetical protein
MLKRIILLIFITIGIIGCKKESAKEIAKTNIESFLKKKMNDPDSYEFVEMTDIDTVAKNEYFSFMKISNEKAVRDVYDIVYKDSEDKVIVTEFSMRAKNAFGSKMLQTLKIILTDSLTVKDIITE